MENFLSGRSSFNADKPFSGGGPAKSFQPLFVPPVADAATKDASGGDAQAEPEIEVIEGAEGIERIIVKCTCGQCIELRCDYE